MFGLEFIEYKFSAKLLEHSLNEHPKDLLITEDDIIDIIKQDRYFKNKINEIINKHENSNSFDTSDENESLSFQNGDLFLSLHNAYIDVIGKRINNKWNLDVALSDKYDFTNFQEIGEYIKNDDFLKGFFGSVGNNLAMIGTSCKVVNEYNITIEFKIKNVEV